MMTGVRPASRMMSAWFWIMSFFAATRRTCIFFWSTFGLMIWKSSETSLMSYGTCCSASHWIASLASSSLRRSMRIFFTMTARPDTAVVTTRFRIWRDSMRLEMASWTSWRSMISPSTMASESGSEIPKFTRRSPDRSCAISTTLIELDPISSPTVLFFLPNMVRPA